MPGRGRKYTFITETGCELGRFTGLSRGRPGRRGGTLTSDVLSRPAPPPDLVLAYGAGPQHVADVRLPRRPAGWSPGVAQGAPRPAPLVMFLHGGFWRSAFDRTHTGPLATALAAAGFAVCVPEFRRTGQRGGLPMKPSVPGVGDLAMQLS